MYNGSDDHKIKADLFGPSIKQHVRTLENGHGKFNKQTATHAWPIVLCQ